MKQISPQIHSHFDVFLFALRAVYEAGYLENVCTCVAVHVYCLNK